MLRGPIRRALTAADMRRIFARHGRHEGIPMNSFSASSSASSSSSSASSSASSLTSDSHSKITISVETDGSIPVARVSGELNGSCQEEFLDAIVEFVSP